MKTDKNRIDAINRRILAHMQENARDTYSAIASTLKLSVNTVRDRVIAMERRGVIQGYGPVLDLEKRGFTTRLMAFLHASPGAPDCDESNFVHPYIQAAYLSPSRYRLIIELAGPDLQTLRDFITHSIEPCGYHNTQFEILETPVPKEEQAPVATPSFSFTNGRSPDTSEPLTPLQ